MSRLAILIFGIVTGILIMALYNYYIDIGVQFGIEFFLGALLVLILLGIGSVFFNIYFLNKKSAKRQELVSTAEPLLKKYFPSIDNEQVENIKSHINEFISYRTLLVSLRILINAVVIVGGMIGTYILIKQNELLAIQNEKIENQNTLFEGQNELVKLQNELLIEQTKYLNAQTELFDNQNQLVATQNDHIQSQNYFSQREYYSELVSGYKDKLANKDFATESKLQALDRLCQLNESTIIDEGAFVVDVNNLDVTARTIENKDLNKFSFLKSSFTEATFNNLKFHDCSFRNCQFVATKMSNVDFKNTRFENCAFGITFGIGVENQDFAFERISGYFNYSDYQPYVLRTVSFDGSIFYRTDFRYCDLRNVEGIHPESFTIDDIDAGYFFGTMLNDSQIMDEEIKEIMRENGVIFNMEDLYAFVNTLKGFNIKEGSRVNAQKIINYYENLSID